MVCLWIAFVHVLVCLWIASVHVFQTLNPLFFRVLRQARASSPLIACVSNLLLASLPEPPPCRSAIMPSPISTVAPTQAPAFVAVALQAVPLFCSTSNCDQRPAIILENSEIMFGDSNKGQLVLGGHTAQWRPCSMTPSQSNQSASVQPNRERKPSLADQECAGASSGNQRVCGAVSSVPALASENFVSSFHLPSHSEIRRRLTYALDSVPIQSSHDGPGLVNANYSSSVRPQLFDQDLHLNLHDLARPAQRIASDARSKRKAKFISAGPASSSWHVRHRISRNESDISQQRRSQV